MKLKLEELLPYLLYDLKIQVSGEFLDDDPEGLPRIFTMVGIVDGEIIRNKQGYIRNIEEDIEDVFPILKPLSDLSNEIEEGKPMFFPSHKLIKHIEQQQDIFNCSYSEIDYLIRNHFDVFGLIEKGLAINKNILIEKDIEKENEIDNFSDRFHPKD
jgi:hypothetical protein